MCCLKIRSVVPVAEQPDMPAVLVSLFGTIACCNQASVLTASITLLFNASSCVASAYLAASVLRLQLTGRLCLQMH